MSIAEIIIRILVFAAGSGLILWTALSAARVVLIPLRYHDFIIRRVTSFYYSFFRFLIKRRVAPTFEARERIFQFFAPATLITVPIVWLGLIAVGYSMLLWVVIPTLTPTEAFVAGSSSFLTLGFGDHHNVVALCLEFTAAMIGFILIAMININYLPTAYSTYQQREELVKRLDFLAGSPPSVQEMILRSSRLWNRGIEELEASWNTWRMWFEMLEDTHVHFLPIIFFRSRDPDSSWLTAAGVILDTAAFFESSINVKRTPERALLLRSGYLALRAIADAVRIPYPVDPKPNDRISIAKEEFKEVYDTIRQSGIDVKPDFEQCWRDFAAWRVNYDAVLLQLAALIMAPYGPWVSDRSLRWPTEAITLPIKEEKKKTRNRTQDNKYKKHKFRRKRRNVKN